MKTVSRRDVLRTSLLAPAAAVAAGRLAGDAAAQASGSATAAGEAQATAASPAPGGGRERLLLDFGWRFHLGHACEPEKDFGYGGTASGNFQKTGNFLPAGSLSFDDSGWRDVDLPHDWAIELPFENDPELQGKGFHPLGRRYPATSVGWYRRVFELPAGDEGRRITIEFDGAYRETLVVMNGFYVGRHSGGYDPFAFDVTDFCSPGQPNVLLVRVDATQTDGWFYEGAGIYRHVWLVKTHPVHVARWGAFVRSELRPEGAALSILTEVDNDGDLPASVRVVSTVLDPAGAAAAQDAADAVAVTNGERRELRQQVDVARPKLWSLEERNLYTLRTELLVAGQVVDRHETPFGIRSVRFDAARGFLLNGAPVKLKGTCNHQDHAGVGAALPDAVQRFRVRKLQEMGGNAIRTSHNPPTPELLDACDRMGVLVFDETRMMSSNPEGLQQFENLVRRDRNHPSVFMWSMGNEESQSGTPRGARILSAMKAVATRHDGSRPVSIAPIFAIGTGGLLVGDVVGYNYMDPQAEAYHAANPDKPVIGTETVSAVGTRGVYVTDKARGFVASYDPYTTTGRASAEGWWRFCNARPWLAGGFVWTGFDYRGEPSPNGWPNVSSQYGVLDTCGFPKDTFFYYRSWWTSEPVLHLFPHWNWPGHEGRTIAVWVYSNLDEVELLHNGRPLGRKAVPKDSHVAWVVPYAPGSIEARGFKGGQPVMTARRDTTGPAARLVLRADRDSLAADGEDVAMLAAYVEDAQGRTVPVTDQLVTFAVQGPARVIGVGNGDPTDQSPDRAASRRAFSGCCMALVQSTKSAGTVRVEASSPGLAPAAATLVTGAAERRPQVAVWERPVPKGAGVTGLWRVEPGAPDRLAAFLGAPRVFTLTQEGGRLSGTVEGSGGFFGGDDTPVPIVDGAVDGERVAFRSGINDFDGRIAGDRIELRRNVRLPFGAPTLPAPDPHRPDIGPAPDGTDPSIDLSGFGGAPAPIILRRAER